MTPQSQPALGHLAHCPIGRFAPSPTGELHLGSLTTALASYCQIKALGGQWRLRIEDTDTQRCAAQFSKQILVDLDALGLHWDGQILYQSERTDIYNAYLHDQLSACVYACQCSRKTLTRYCHTHQLPTHRYPRRCLGAQLNWQGHKLRVQLPDVYTGFYDRLQGMQWVNPQQTLGDMVLRRQNGLVNYLLAASIDDGLQGITHVVRGLDILYLTGAQIALRQAAGFVGIDQWYHLPLVTNVRGQKLSKQNLAAPIDTRHPSELLAQAWQLLAQPALDMDTPQRMITQAVAQWDDSLLVGRTTLASDPR